MKKMLAMLLAVLTLCFGAAAMAESVPEVDDAAEQAALTDLTANGQLIEGDGFQFYIPADWEAAELTDEETEAGYVFAAASADEANQLIITYQALDAAKTAEEVQPGLAEVYPTATVMDLNGTSVVAFHDADEDVLGGHRCDGYRRSGLLHFHVYAGFRRGLPAGGRRDCRFLHRGAVRLPNS